MYRRKCSCLISLGQVVIMSQRKIGLPGVKPAGRSNRSPFSLLQINAGRRAQPVVDGLANELGHADVLPGSLVFKGFGLRYAELNLGPDHRGTYHDYMSNIMLSQPNYRRQARIHQQRHPPPRFALFESVLKLIYFTSSLLKAHPAHRLPTHCAVNQQAPSPLSALSAHSAVQISLSRAPKQV